LGKLDASGSCWISSLPEKRSITLPSSPNSIKPSCFSAVRTKNNKKIKITLKKVAGGKGYQIQYATSKKFTRKTTKTVKVKKNIKTITKLPPTPKGWWVGMGAWKNEGSFGFSLR
jgi:hypothetical protein